MLFSSTRVTESECWAELRRPSPTPAPGAGAGGPRARHLHGFRLTLRHQMILVAYFAALFAVLVPVVEGSGPSAAFNAVLTTLLLSPWLLAALELALDRPDPLKYWSAPLLQILFAPAVAVSYDLALFSGWVEQGTVSSILPTLLIKGVCFGVFAVYLSAVYPAPCPSCGQRTLIPVFFLWGRSLRTLRSRWCASCGAAFWKRHAGI